MPHGNCAGFNFAYFGTAQLANVGGRCDVLVSHRMSGESEGRDSSPDESSALLLTKADLARELRTSVKTIDRMDNAGKLPRAVRVGRAKRWGRQTIVTWIAAGCPDRHDFERFHKKPQ